MPSVAVGSYSPGAYLQNLLEDFGGYCISLFKSRVGTKKHIRSFHGSIIFAKEKFQQGCRKLRMGKNWFDCV